VGLVSISGLLAGVLSWRWNVLIIFESSFSMLDTAVLRSPSDAVVKPVPLDDTKHNNKLKMISLKKRIIIFKNLAGYSWYK
jgi:hypothetical protein